MSQIQVRDVNGRGIPRVNIRISQGKKSSDEAIYDVFTDLAGNTGWPIPFWPAGQYTLWINDRNVLDAFQSASTVVTTTDDQVVVLPFVEAPRIEADLRALHVDGPLLRLPDGTPWRWKLVTAFDAARRFERGELDALRAYAQWTRECGGNGWRIFGGWSRTGFDFRKVPDYFTRALPGLCEFLGEQGLRGEFVCVTDSIPSTTNDQRAFLQLCADILQRYPHMFMQFANEPWKNGLDPLAFEIRRPGLLISRGAAAPDSPPYQSIGYTTIHPPRSEDWARKAGKDSYETRALTHDVVIPDEPIGFAEDMKNARTNNAVHAFVAGVGAGMFCPGITAHGDNDTMQLCNVPGPRESKCVSEEFRGVDLVPREAPTWRYARYGPDNPGIPMPIQDDAGPGRLTDHMHAMMSDKQAVVCNYYPSPGWVAGGANGWRVIEQQGSFVRCER